MIKRRDTITYKGVGRSWFTQAGVIYPGSDQSTTYTQLERQITTSQGTAFVSRRNDKKFKGHDLGSDFSTQKVLAFQPVNVNLKSGEPAYIVYHYTGPYWATTPNSLSFLPGPSIAQMNSYGASCIAKALPTNPLSGMGQFLGELRDLPKLPLLKLMQAKARGFRELFRATGSEYLNVQFGWVPFVKDLLDLSKVLREADEKIAQYDRDSGRNVRRRLTLLNTTQQTIQDLGTAYGFPPAPGPMYVSPGRLFKTVTTTTQIKFSGAFTYHFASGNTPAAIEKSKGGGQLTSFIAPRSDPRLVRRREMQIRNKLYGLRLDPYLLYQLFPWSWAADWMTNLGSNVRNAVAFSNDGLVLRYGYVMHFQRVTTMYELVNLKFSTSGPPAIRDVYVQVTKVRTKATPFGFGLNPNTFSARQLAIIAALGMSRAPR